MNDKPEPPQLRWIKNNMSDKQVLGIILAVFSVVCAVTFTFSYQLSKSRVDNLNEINYVIYTKNGNKYLVHDYYVPDEDDINYSFIDNTGTKIKVPRYEIKTIENIPKEEGK